MHLCLVRLGSCKESYQASPQSCVTLTPLEMTTKVGTRQFSTEKPRAEIGLLPLPDDEYAKGAVEELSPMSNFRVRILPVLGPLPAMVRYVFFFFGCIEGGRLMRPEGQFGNAAAAYVLQTLAGFSMETLALKLVTPSPRHMKVTDDDLAEDERKQSQQCTKLS